MVKSRAKATTRSRRTVRAKPKIAREPQRCRTLVLGVGGAGNSVVNRLSETGVSAARCVVADTDLQSLTQLQVPQKVQIGDKTALGLGAGGNPKVGKAAIEESKQALSELMNDADVVFLAVGLGGGTGSSVAPILAEMARQKGAVAVGVVTTPIKVDTEKTAQVAFALDELRRACDTVVIIDSSKFTDSDSNLSLKEAFKVIDQVSADTIKSIVESISAPGLISLDFADFKTMVQKGGVATVTVGESDAPNRAEQAVRNAFSNPLLGVECAGAAGALVQINGDSHMKLEEANQVGSIVSEMLGHDTIVRWGARNSTTSNGFLKVTLVMTGVQPPRKLSGIGVIMPKIYDLESSYSEPERQLQIDLGLDQIENFEE